jgi:adenylate kinase
MDRGELVGDDLMIDIVRDRLARADTSRGFVLDGFPRTIKQAEALDKMMGGRGLIVLKIAAPAEEIVKRLSSRRICSACKTIADPGQAQAVAACAKCGGELVQRSDDREEVVRERLNVYERSTRPLLDYYGGRPTFRAVDGVQSPDQVADAIRTAIEQMQAVER